MARTPIYAAGGIVVRGRARPLIAVVQRSKDERWVLPRGKLKRDENPMVGARREVVEETGHRVQVHEFLGAITYRVRGRSKLVQFWRMQAYERPSRDVMSDIIAVEWLPLGQAVRRLSYPLERLFLQHAGRRVLKRRRHGARRKRSTRRTRGAKRRTARSWFRMRRKQRPAAAGARGRTGKARLRRTRPRAQSRSAAPARVAAAKQAASPRIVAPHRRTRRRTSMLQRVFGRLGR
jgi:8-oxo-dGTP diphosphatase